MATETAAHLELVSGPEILSRWVGESEAHLRQVFARARAHPPAVLLIDELDALAGRRDTVDHHHQAQLVAQLLVLLDGLDARGQVVVLATTNRRVSNQEPQRVSTRNGLDSMCEREYQKGALTEDVLPADALIEWLEELAAMSYEERGVSVQELGELASWPLEMAARRSNRRSSKRW